MPLVGKTNAGLPYEALPLQLGPGAALAAAGTVIANAAAIVNRVTIVSGADDTKGVVLPSTPSPGDVYVIYSSTATSGLKVYPPVNSTLNDGSANSALVMEGKTMAIAIALNSTNWGLIFTLNT